MNERRAVTLELCAIGALAAIFLLALRTRPPVIDVIFALVALALILTTATRTRRLWADAAGRAEGEPWHAWLASTLFTMLALVGLVGLTFVTARGSDISLLERFGNWRVILVAALYFPWALLQQFIFQFYLFPRWLRLVPTPVAMSLTALTFAAVHFPRWPVMAVTLVAGAGWAFLYYRWRRLLPLAVSHAVLGATLHYWVLGNDLLEGWLTRRP